MMRQRNWLRRDIQIKRLLGFPESYWHRAASVLRLAARGVVQGDI
jgi:hypothetical protein